MLIAAQSQDNSERSVSDKDIVYHLGITSTNKVGGSYVLVRKVIPKQLDMSSFNFHQWAVTHPAADFILAGKGQSHSKVKKHVALLMNDSKDDYVLGFKCSKSMSPPSQKYIYFFLQTRLIDRDPTGAIWHWLPIINFWVF